MAKETEQKCGWCVVDMTRPVTNWALIGYIAHSVTFMFIRNSVTAKSHQISVTETSHPMPEPTAADATHHCRPQKPQGDGREAPDR